MIKRPSGESGAKELSFNLSCPADTKNAPTAVRGEGGALCMGLECENDVLARTLCQVVLFWSGQRRANIIFRPDSDILQASYIYIRLCIG